MAESTWSPTPSAPSLATLQRWVAGYVGLPDDTEGLEAALAGIRMALDRINSRVWNWGVVFEDVVFDSAVIDYPLPSNFKKVQRFMMLNSDSNPVFRLPYKPWQTFLNEHQESTTAGDPCVYSCANIKEYGTISLDRYPTPEWVAKYPTGRLFYYRKVQYDAQDGTGDWPSEFTPFVYHEACGFIAGIYAPAKSQGCYAISERRWNDLVRDDNEQQTDWE